MRRPYVKTYYCNFRMGNVDEADSVCINCFCVKDITAKGAQAYFLEFPVESQLIRLFQQHEFRENLKHWSVRKDKSPNDIEDINDGNVYQNLSSKSNPLHNDQDVSFTTMNIDGVAVFKSSQSFFWLMNSLLECANNKKYAMWPLVWP